MTSKVKSMPDGYHSIIPYTIVESADSFIEFLQLAFGADISECIREESGRIMHAEARIGDSIIMISEACPEMGPIKAGLYHYTDDVDSVFKQAVANKAEPTMEPADMFWGDRMGSVRDPWGNIWWIATHVEDVTPAELAERARAFAEQCQEQTAENKEG